MRRCTFLIAALLLLYSVPLHARSLYWSSIDVDATLDRDGVLEVAETQTFVFDGDWNGGERTFNVRHMQRLQLLGVDRIDGGKVIPMRSGNLSVVDTYQLMDGRVLRWRSRKPTDPPFDNTTLTYRIRYRLHGVLRGRNNQYRLNHDFLFPDRSGVVQRFSLRLRTDSAWSGIEPVLTQTARNVVPGEGFVVTRELTWKGGAAPAAVTTLPSPIGGQVAIALIVIGIAAIAYKFFIDERRRGRFGGLTPAAEINDAWLESNIFSFSPEAIGTAWDDKVGASEVAAVIATLAQEKKIETSVEPRFFRGALLKMRLLVDRDSVDGHHGAVLRKLFFNRSMKGTDTDSIRTRYKGSGLDLAALISGPIESELSRIRGWSSKAKPLNWKLGIGSVVASVVLAIAVAIWKGGNDAALVATTLFFGVFAAIGSLIAAKVSSDALTKFPLRVAIVFAFIALPLYFLLDYFRASSEFLFGIAAMLACASFALALVNLAFMLLRTTQSHEKILFRKKVMSARKYLLAQLKSAQPRLRDDWFPYLLALGLGKNVESWFRSYGDTAAASSTSSLSRSSTSTSSSFDSSSRAGSSGWTGGGGSFGGAGATGSWALAAAAVGAGVSAPSTSSGGSSGGSSSSSSSSSSGGGGGGGW